MDDCYGFCGDPDCACSIGLGCDREEIYTADQWIRRMDELEFAIGRALDNLDTPEEAYDRAMDIVKR
jgi:hypothetical protein